jgi:hypothetical protein
MTGNPSMLITDVVRHFQRQVLRIIQITMDMQRPGELGDQFELFLTLEDDPWIDDHQLQAMQNLHTTLDLQPPGQLRRVSNKSRPRNSMPY